MAKEFPQIEWGRELRADAERLLHWAFEEDLGTGGDLTSRALVPDDVEGAGELIARRDGIAAGIPLVPEILRIVDGQLQWNATVRDGQPIAAGRALGRLAGPARSILTAERVLLNMLGRLCGVATLTRAYVDAIAGTGTRIYDTRKTTPGWRRLEKYAVRCGGGFNHRFNLEAAVLIKDNHLAFGTQRWRLPASATPGEAVRRVRNHLSKHFPAHEVEATIIEVEVDSLELLESALDANPDIVLLDNMAPAQLAEAVKLRDHAAPQVELEASGTVSLISVREIAASGVERISVGALTHSAASLDLSLDWHCEAM